MDKKRRVSVLVPYRIENNSVCLFMQKRKKDHTRGGDMFGFFGGGIEGSETPEEGLLREIKEELNFVPQNFSLFKKYELEATKYFSSAELYLYILKVNENFEKEITVKEEGQYGKWFEKNDYIKNKKFIAGSLFIMDELYDKLITHNF